MAETKETIEAKLCAYVDDELTPAERAEIEQHLIANPGHRVLLEQLRQTRDMLGELPMAQAPEEILEAVQGQLERDSLLINAEKELYPTESNHWRWPQFTLIAAMLLLALGLAFVVLSALTTTHPASFAVQADPSLNSVTASDHAAEGTGRSGDPARPRDLLTKSGEPTVPPLVGKGGSAAVFVDGSADQKAELPQIVMVIASGDAPKATIRVVEVLTSRQLPWRAAAADSTVLAGLSPGRSLEELGISPASPETAMNRALVNARDGNGQWRSPDEGTRFNNAVASNVYIPPVGQVVATDPERLSKGGEPAHTSNAGGPITTPTPADAAPVTTSTPGNTVVSKSIAGQESPSLDTAKQQEAPPSKGGLADALPPNAPPSLNAEQTPANGASQSIQQAANLSPAQPEPAINQQAKLANPIAGGDAAITQGFASAREYVIEDISQEQALLIMRAISTDSSVTIARVYQSHLLVADPRQGSRGPVMAQAAVDEQVTLDRQRNQYQQIYPQQTIGQRPQVDQQQLAAQQQLPSMTGLLATTQPAANLGATSQQANANPADAVIVQGQDLIIEIAELKGSGLETVTNARVREDGTIVLPALVPVNAAGLTLAQLREHVKAEYAATNTIANATVKVTAVTTGPQVQVARAAQVMPTQEIPAHVQHVQLTIVVQSRPDLQQDPAPVNPGRWVVNGGSGGDVPSTMNMPEVQQPNAAEVQIPANLNGSNGIGSGLNTIEPADANAPPQLPDPPFPATPVPANAASATQPAGR